MESTTTKSKAQEIHDGLDDMHSMMKELTDTKLIFNWLGTFGFKF